MRGDFIVFLFFYVGYIISLCKFCEKYLNGFQINRKIFIILLLVIEAGVNFGGALAAPYILRADRRRTCLLGWTVSWERSPIFR